MLHECEWCGKHFEGKSNARYCSSSCRARASLRRKSEAKESEEAKSVLPAMKFRSNDALLRDAIEMCRTVINLFDEQSMVADDLEMRPKCARIALYLRNALEAEGLL